jgi:hypothetical protein
MARPTRRAHRLTNRDVVAPLLRRMNLIGTPTRGLVAHGFGGVGLGRIENRRTRIRRDAVTKRAEQRVNRQARYFPGQIPERHIDRADRPHAGHSAARPAVGNDALAPERIASEHKRFEIAEQALGIDVCRIEGGTQKSMPRQTIVRGELE